MNYSVRRSKLNKAFAAFNAALLLFTFVGSPVVALAQDIEQPAQVQAPVEPAAPEKPAEPTTPTEPTKSEETQKPDPAVTDGSNQAARTLDVLDEEREEQIFCEGFPFCSGNPFITGFVVNKVVVNNDGGTALANAFSFNIVKKHLIFGSTSTTTYTFEADGSNFIPTVFDPLSSYTINEVAPTGYTPSYSGSCTQVGSPLFATPTCTITNDDVDAPVNAPVIVHIFKHLKTDAGTAQVPDTYTGAESFPMVAVYDIAGLAAGSDPYPLGNGGDVWGSDGDLDYAANTRPLAIGDDYATHENTDGSLVLPADAQCVADKYRLVGYKVGDTYAAAEAATVSTVSPSFPNIASDKYVIVVNEDCDDLAAPDTQAPSVPVNGTPHNTAIDTNSFVFNWDASTDDSTDPITYEFQSSLNGAQANGVLTTGLWQSGTLPSNSIVSAGAPDGTWYWQVRAKDAAGNYSAWSEIWNVTLDTSAPAMPMHLSPADAAIVTVSSFLFDWTDVADATGVVYEWIGSLNNTLNPDGSLANVLAAHTGLATSEVNSPGTPDNTYFWQVRAKDAAGNYSAWTAPWMVKVDTVVPTPIDETAPTAPVITFPAAEQVFPTSPILNDWTDATDASGIQKYEIEYVYDDGHTFTDGPYRETAGNVTEREHAPGTNEQGGVTIRVRAYDVHGNVSAWSNSVHYFYTVPVIPNEPTEPQVLTVSVSGNTSSGENVLGWMFNRDAGTQTPFSFAAGNQNTGSGSLFIPAITNTVVGNADKFIAELFLQKTIADLNSISYAFKIAGPAETAKSHFYVNVYANFGSSSATKFYDCRYNMLTATGSMTGYTTVTFDPTQTYSVATRTDNPNTVENEASPQACPASPAAMGEGATIRAIAINVGDTSANDAGVSGYLDTVIVNTDSVITTYDFEAAPVENPGNGDEEEEEEQTPSSNRSGSSRRTSSTQGEVLGASTGPDTTCEALITGYLGMGHTNDTGEVSKLQTFLNTEMGSGLPVTGIFGALTKAAVQAFQLKYATDILAPWIGMPGSDITDLDDATGYVYITTQRKINQLSCGSLELPPLELK